MKHNFPFHVDKDSNLKSWVMLMKSNAELLGVIWQYYLKVLF